MIPGLDRKDQFQTGYTVRGGITRRMMKRPEWMSDDRKIKLLLLQVFPKLNSDKRQRKQAKRWLLIIRLYFKAGLSARDIVEELERNREYITEKMVYDTAQRIIRAATGARTTGKPRIGKRGRPKSKYF